MHTLKSILSVLAALTLSAAAPAALAQATIKTIKADKRSDSYACNPKEGTAKPPEKRAECPDRLSYFEKSAAYGCSK